ncbi:hypothetical protein [Nocardia sp. IFM 10818]
MSDSPPDLRPENLGDRGAALWAALMAPSGQDAARAVLAGEAARLADRLDHFDRLLSGDPECWMRLRTRDTDTAAVLVVDSAAGEARQTANTLRQLIAQLTDASAPTAAGGSLEDELARRRVGRDTGT